MRLSILTAEKTKTKFSLCLVQLLHQLPPPAPRLSPPAHPVTTSASSPTLPLRRPPPAVALEVSEGMLRSNRFSKLQRRRPLALLLLPSSAPARQHRSTRRSD